MESADVRARRSQRPARRRELWGLGLLLAAGVAYWWSTYIWEQPDPSDVRIIYFSYGVSGEAVRGWTQMISIITGTIGLSALVLALLGRVPRRWPRRIAGWAAVLGAMMMVPYLALAFFTAVFITGITDYTKFTATDGQSVVVTQDGFDGDAVSIYTEYDDTHYVFDQNARSLSGFPRVRDRDCRLSADNDQLLFTCDADTVRINPR